MADKQATHYSIAGSMLVCQNAMEGLDAFRTGLATPRATELLNQFKEPPMMTLENSLIRYVGKAYFDGHFRDVRFWRKEGGLKLILTV